MDNRGWFGGDGLHLREFYEQLLKLTLLVRLGQADMRHGLILAQRQAEEKPPIPKATIVFGPRLGAFLL